MTISNEDILAGMGRMLEDMDKAGLSLTGKTAALKSFLKSARAAQEFDRVSDSVSDVINNDKQRKAIHAENEIKKTANTNSGNYWCPHGHRHSPCSKCGSAPFKRKGMQGLR